jgi:histidine kinase
MREFGRKVELTEELVDVNTSVNRAFTLLNKQFVARGIKMRWDLADNLPPIMAISDKLEQVIINLLVNSRDALEEKTWDGDSDTPFISVKTVHQKKAVVVEVVDNGGGIPEKLIQKIFEPFFTTKKVGKGTGLGLSISYGLIKDFGGTIHAENSEFGARFTIKLPVAES